MAITISGEAFGVLIAAIAALGVGKALYNVFLHPLRSFPGPLICRATPFYRHYKFLKGSLLYDLKDLHDKYGPVVRVRPDELSFISPQAWADIYLAQDSPNGPVELARYDRFYQFAGPGAPETIVSLDKNYHAHLKRVLSPAFSDRSLRLQEPMMQEYVSLLIQRLHEQSKNGEQAVNLRNWYNYLTFDIIGNLGFGSDFAGLKNAVLHPWVKAVTQNIREFSFLQVLMYLGCQRIVHILANSSLLKGKLLHENLTREKLDARLAQYKERPDLLEPLIQLKDPVITHDQLLANATQLITAGSESSSTLLTATTSLLGDNPEAMRKLAEEVRSTFQSEEEITLTAVNNLPYLSACLYETLRRFPAVPPSLPRVTPPTGAIICGHEIPPKTVVSLAQWAAYNTDEHWTDPFGYHPERFLRDEKFANDRFDAHQPFGLGYGSCPGRNLAWAETRLALTRVVYNFDIESAPVSKGWVARQKAYLLWDKEDFWAHLKPVRKPRA
ncbi:cytochrome P450 ClCP1 [Thelonectria olida]|uniref:Cytochrome P450 ClCP1 n=1 Tax=Thelonectria olida TaxID=1576542 RepID=A0A9P9AMW9_9HYPO|nr:cytochrome P450 ClCP1 [Thelonectria olida]